MVNRMLFVLGPFLAMAATMLICTPIFLPICMQYGMSPVQFGVVMLLNCALGLNTPPVGTVQFVGCAIGKVSVGTVMRTIWPFYGALVAALALVRSAEHTSELQSLMRISYAVFCLKKNT